MVRPIEFDVSLHTGDATVDEQHRELVALVNRVIEAERADHGADVIGTTLEQLAAYTATHFACEECFMDDHGYPEEAARAHIAEHRALTERTRDFILRFRMGEVTSVVPLIRFLQEWLAHHIGQSDRALVDHIRGLEAEAQSA